MMEKKKSTIWLYCVLITVLILTSLTIGYTEVVDYSRGGLGYEIGQIIGSFLAGILIVIILILIVCCLVVFGGPLGAFFGLFLFLLYLYAVFIEIPRTHGFQIDTIVFIAGSVVGIFAAAFILSLIFGGGLIWGGSPSEKKEYEVTRLGKDLAGRQKYKVKKK